MRSVSIPRIIGLVILGAVLSLVGCGGQWKTKTPCTHAFGRDVTLDTRLSAGDTISILVTLHNPQSLPAIIETRCGFGGKRDIVVAHDVPANTDATYNLNVVRPRWPNSTLFGCELSAVRDSN